MSPCHIRASGHLHQPEEEKGEEEEEEEEKEVEELEEALDVGIIPPPLPHPPL